MIPAFGEGLIKTLSIFFLTLIISLPLGLGVSMCRMSKNFFVRNITKIYISIMRGTPLMLQLLFVYFGPFYIIGISYDRFVATIIAFGLNYAAYFAEIYRSGIQSMSVGQYEAASVLGYSKSQTFLRIIFPQVIKNILPSMANEVITLVKDTSLAQVLAVDEMFKAAKSFATATSSVVPFFVAGLFYYIMNYAVAFLFDYIEKKLNYYK